MFAPLFRNLAGALLCASLLLLLGADAEPLPAQCHGRAQSGVPSWFLEHLESRMAGGGRWIASNQAYVGDCEPIDAYGIEWQWGAGRKSLRGRVFALTAGRETATIWDLRILWHPGEQRAQVLQYGSDGTLVVGLLESQDEGRTRLQQTFHAPDGSTRSVRCFEDLEPDGAWVSSTFVESSAGWVPERTYVWLPRNG